MIASYFSGRAGNQMFQYAFLRKIWEERGRNDKLIFNFNLVNGRKSEKGYKDIFEDFSVLPYRIDDDNLVLRYGSFIQRLYYLLFQLCLKFSNNNRWIRYQWFKRFRKKGLLFFEHWENDPLEQSIQERDLIVYGKFENELFFQDIKPILQKEFVPKFPPFEQNAGCYKFIEEHNTICVHIRRGDFLSDEFRKDFYVCDEDYYNQAIKLMMQNVDNPVFFFCSNDIEWVKNNIKVDVPCMYEPIDNPLWETFRMMYSCKHFIISNSTLSWWAQYLSKNENKIVISPNHWYNNPEKDKYARLLMNFFLQIPTRWH